MKLSAKGRYGLKVMSYLGSRFGEDAISLSNISEAINVSDKYAEQILLTLRKSDLVQATRGANGGYFIERNPSEISVGEILRALEDGLVIVDCISEGCPNQNKCNTYVVWDKLYKQINGFLDSLMLDSILAKEGE